MDALTVFARHSTLCLRRRELLLAGVSPRSIAAAVHARVIIRARRGVYCPASAPRHVVRALRVGGLAACTTAAESYGLWVPEQRITEVWLPRQASRLRAPDNRRVPLAHADRSRLRTHWHPLNDPGAADSWRVGAFDAVAQCVGCLPRDVAIAVLDSALRTGAIGAHELTALEVVVPARRRGWVNLADGRAGSGTESLVRLALQHAGLRVTPQVWIAGVGRVDLLVGTRVVVEVDSEKWHSTPEQRAEDSRRDLELIRLGYVVVRVRYGQAFRPDEVVTAVLRAVRTSRSVTAALRHRRS
ncbi:endonuclease domain-containing protein [Microcella sp.]|uniref:endonuclease domain-containing protein n=1 Tax=Microcella sp. TaxID=1913979 RepID=UPI002560A68D|nr:type IV toxin-antitoxin system AbiEi family antitoxin domain-containing protein [Microcella sp.]